MDSSTELCTWYILGTKELYRVITNGARIHSLRYASCQIKYVLKGIFISNDHLWMDSSEKLWDLYEYVKQLCVLITISCPVVQNKFVHNKNQPTHLHT